MWKNVYNNLYKMKKIKKPVDWLWENKEKYPNGTVNSKIMEGYAKYYHQQKIENDNT